MKLTITTTQGKQIELTANGFDIQADVEIKGEVHSFFGAEIHNNSTFGWFLKFGPAKAIISAETAQQIKATLVAHNKAEADCRRRQHDAEKAAFLASPEGKVWLINKKMDQANSDY